MENKSGRFRGDPTWVVWVALWNVAPLDILEQIEKVLRRERAALAIQRCTRGHLSRSYYVHRRHNRWKDLRIALELVMEGSVDLLERYDVVRTEWGREPESWITSMRGEYALNHLRAIILETTMGWWSTRPTPQGSPIAQT